jgi:hypothetical protein
MSKRVTWIFAAAGLIVPLVIVISDIATHGRGPVWLTYFWPTSWFFPPMEADYLDPVRLMVCAIYAVLNSALFAGIGLVLSELIRLTSSRDQS